MGLFDDDFYSTKVARPRGGMRLRRSKEEPHHWKAHARSGGWAPWKVSLLSSLCGAFVAVLLFSLFTGLPSSSPSSSSQGHLTTLGATDPYERISTAAAKVAPAVVSILNYNDDTVNAEQSALGSGVIFKKTKDKAYIITNTHVIADASNLEVITSDGSSHKVKVVGQDSINDIAVLEIDGKGIESVIDLGDSSKLRYGETVIAVGNPLGLGGTLTSGVVSYTNRLIPISLNQDGIYDWEQEVIQTSAAINEGNSGGALADLNGHLIGINTMKISDMGVEGLGFAIPVNDVMKTVDDLMLHGKVVRPYLGVYTLDLSNPYAGITREQREDLKLPAHVSDGVIVLEAHGPAKDAGLQLNDVIIQLDKQTIDSTKELWRYLYDNKKINEEMEVSFYRDGELRSTIVKLSDKPSDTEIAEEESK